MTPSEIVRAMFDAYLSQDREAAQALLAPDFVFSSPQDDRINKAAYLERCFPTAQRLSWQRILHLVDAGDTDAFILYEYELTTGHRHRNAEFISVRAGQVIEVQVFFGAELTS